MKYLFALSFVCLPLTSCDTIKEFSQTPEGTALIWKGIIEASNLAQDRYDRDKEREERGHGTK